MKKILIINPVLTGNQPLGTLKNKKHFFNTSLLYLGSFLELKKHKVKIIDLNIEFHPQAKLKKIIKEFSPDYALISLRWYFEIYPCIEASKHIKKLNEGIKTIIGGHTASYFDLELAENPYVDFVIRGDGEIPVLNIIEEKEKINVTFKDKKNKIIRKPINYTQESQELDEIYLTPNIISILESPHKFFNKPSQWLGDYIWTGKGCNYNCFYCGANKSNQEICFKRKKPIFRKTKHVINDISIMKKFFHSKKLIFDFDPFMNNKEFYYRLFDKIDKKKYSCRFYAWTLPPKELILSLKETFTDYQICFSIDSGDEKLRKKLHKMNLSKPFFSNEELYKTIDVISKNGGTFKSYFIADNPLAEKYSFLKTKKLIVNLIKKYPKICTDFCIERLSIEPGSYIYKFPEKFEISLTRKSFNSFYSFSKDVFHSGQRYPFDAYRTLSLSSNLIKSPHGFLYKNNKNKYLNKEIYKLYKTIGVIALINKSLYNIRKYLKS